MIEGHGDDLYRYDADMVRMNFSSNVYPHADHTALKEHLSAHLDMIKHYQEPRTRSLEKLIALKLGLSSESVMVTNGATEAIYLIAQMLHHSASVIPQPTFSEYADACRINHHIISYENTEDLSSLPSDRVYWICNPNNPTGNVMTKGVIEYIVRRSPRYTFVIDQSYEDYTQEELLSPKEVLSCRNLFVLHSLGKKYAMPGLRLGYVTAHPDTLQLLRTFQQPWSVNALAIEAGKFLIKQDKPAIPYLDAYLMETERLRTRLREIEGIRWTRQCVGHWSKELVPLTDELPEGVLQGWKLGGEFVNDEPSATDTDIWAMQHQLLAITPLTLDWTDYGSL